MNTVTRARWTPQYYQKVLALDPILYVMQDEKQGAVSYDMVTARSDGARNGAYTGVTLGQPGIGDGRTSPLYDGANDYTNLHSAAFVSAFNGAEGTVMIWARVSGADVWWDAAFRRVFYFRVDASNYITIGKTTVVNQLQWVYRAGGFNAILSESTATSTEFMSLALTWSTTDNQVIAYQAGEQVSAPLAIPGAWAGVLGATTTNIGSQSTAPATVWDGTITHCAVFNRALASAEAKSLAGPYASPRPVMVAFGDSTTVGTGATGPANRWPNIVAAAKAWDFLNAGISSTLLQNTVQNTVAVIGGATTNNGRDTYGARVTVYSPDYVIIMYGLNDIRLNDVAITVANYENDLGEVVDALVASGILVSQIVIGSPPYIDPAQYGAHAPYDGGSTAIHVTYVTAAAAVATAKGTRYADIYQAMLDGGDVALLADGIHPNDAGYALIAATFLAAL